MLSTTKKRSAKHSGEKTAIRSAAEAIGVTLGRIATAVGWESESAQKLLKPARTTAKKKGVSKKKRTATDRKVLAKIQPAGA